MKHLYEAFGAVIASNRPLAALREAPARARHADVVVDFAEGQLPEADERGALTTSRTGSRSARREDDGGWLFRMASHGGERVWSMRVSGDGARIEVRWRGPVELSDITALVEVSGVPTALSLRGVPLLHGCAFAVGESAL